MFNKKTATKTKAQPGHVHAISLVGNDAFMDWTLILSVSCLIAVCMIAVGTYVYIDTQASLTAQGSTLGAAGTSTHFDGKKLTSVINTFDARAEERVVLGKGYNGPKDPSLP